MGVMARTFDGDAAPVGESADDFQAAAVFGIGGALAPGTALILHFDADGRSGAAHADREGSAWGGRAAVDYGVAG